MKKIYQIVCSFLYFSISVIAQQEEEFTYFNKTYFGDTMNILSSVGKPIPGGGIIVGTYVTIDNRYVYIRKIDGYGNTLWIKHLDSETDGEIGAIERGTQAFVSDDNHLYLTYSKNLLNGNLKDPQILKLDFEGNIIWKQSFGGSNQEAIKHIIPTSDGGIMFAGARWFEEPLPSQMYFAKTDSEGILEWDTTYAHNWGSAFSIQQTWWDDGYIVGGYSLTDSTTLFYDSHVLKLDAFGNLEWDRIYGGEEDESAAKVIPATTEENFSGVNNVEYYLLNAYDIADNSVQNPTLTKIGSTGNIIWQRKYHDEIDNLTSFQTFPVINGNKFIFSGLIRNGNMASNIFLEINYENGNIQKANYLKVDTTTNIYFKDIQLTNDGGYLLTGYKLIAPQKSWVLKVDSLGNTCAQADCDSTVLVSVDVGLPNEYQVLQKNKATISPNPAQDFIKVDLNGLVAPSNKELKFKLVAVNGGETLIQSLEPNQKSTTINVAHLRRGLYIYSILEGKKQIQSAKIFLY